MTETFGITFIESDGREIHARASIGQSVMAVAVAAGVGSILAECGGACSCGTCHCQVDADWFARIPAPAEAERGMLEIVTDPTEHSRLSCQIRVTQALDGLVVRVPDRQY